MASPREVDAGPSDPVGQWFLAPGSGSALPEPPSVPTYSGAEESPNTLLSPSTRVLHPRVEKNGSTFVSSVDLLSLGASAYGMTGALLYRAHPYFQSAGFSRASRFTAPFATPIAFRRVAYAGLAGIGWQSARSGVRLVTGEGTEEEREWDRLVMVGAALALANIGVGVGRERILARLRQGDIIFPDAATTRQIRALYTAQMGLLAANSYVDTVALTTLRGEWVDDPSYEKAVLIGLQGGSALAFGLRRHDFETAGRLFRRGMVRGTDVEIVGERVAQRLLASGIEGVQRVAGDPYYLTALFLDAEGLGGSPWPEHFTYRAAERSRGSIEGDFRSQETARQVVTRREELLGLASDPSGFRYRELLPAVLRHMGVEVKKGDLDEAIHRGEAARWLRWLVGEYYPRAVADGQRLGEELEIMAGPSRLNPGEPMRIGEVLDTLTEALTREGWAVEKQPSLPIAVGREVKVFPNVVLDFELRGDRFRIHFSQASGDLAILVYRNGRLMEGIEPVERGAVEDAAVTVFKRLKLNLRHAREALASELGIPVEEVREAIRSGQRQEFGFFKERNGALHIWSYQRSRVHLETFRYGNGVDPDYFTGRFDSFEEAYRSFRHGMETGVDPRPLVDRAPYTRLVARRDGVELGVDLTWELNWAIEVIYHGLRAGGVYDDFLRVTYRALAESGAYGNSRGDCVALQTHAGMPLVTRDGIRTDESFDPAIRILRAYGEDRPFLVEAFPPAPQRRMYIAPPQKREAAPELTPAERTSAAWDEVASPFWNRQPGETEADHFVRIAERYRSLWPRHVGEINLDNYVTARAGRQGLGDGFHLSKRNSPIPTVEYRTTDTPEKVVIGPDGQPTLAFDPEAAELQRQIWISHFYASVNGLPRRP
ncbi:MAG: hypothetical protein HYS22_03390 [Deltaproteobacteria bacterium]|nr:hypothetical protein [Deltaproteobacteria bacterium]